MDIKKVLQLIESAEQQKQPLTEGKNMAKDMVVQHYTKETIKTPIRNPVSKLNEYFKIVNNEMLNVIKEDRDAKRVEVKKIVNRVLERLDEGKKVEASKPRNFVAKNAKTAGAGAHKDKKKAEKQGDLKHKKEKVPMDESEQLSEKAVSKAQQKFMGMVHAAKKGEKPASKEVAKAAKGMSGKAAKDFAKTKHKGLPDKKDKKTDEGVAGPKNCWPGHRKVGTQPGTGKNKGKRVNDCEKIKEAIEVGSPVKVYSNVLKKSVLGTVVKLKEGKAFVNYNNTKIVMAHPVDTVQLNEAAAVAPAAKLAGKFGSKLVPGLGVAAGGYDAYQRAKQGDWLGAGLSGAAGLASTIPGLGTAAATGLLGAQMGRDKARTGSFLPSYDEIGQAGKKGQSATPAGKWPTTPEEIKAYQKANGLTADGLIGKMTLKSLTQAGLKPPEGFKMVHDKNNKLLRAPSPSTKAPVAGATTPTTAPTATTPTTAPTATTATTATTPTTAPTAASSSSNSQVSNRQDTGPQTTVTKDGDTTKTTTTRNTSGTLTGVTQQQIMNHPVYKAEMEKNKGSRMAHDIASMKARLAMVQDSN